MSINSIAKVRIVGLIVLFTVILTGCKRYVCALMSAYQPAILVTACDKNQWYHAWSDVYDRGATIAHVDVVYNLTDDATKHGDYIAANTTKNAAENVVTWFILWGPHERSNALYLKQDNGENMSRWKIVIQYEDELAQKQMYTVQDIALIDEITPWHTQLFGCRYTQFRDIYRIHIPQDIAQKINKAHQVTMRFESLCYVAEVIFC